MVNKDEKEVPDKKRRKTSLTSSDVTIKSKEDIYTVSKIGINKVPEQFSIPILFPVHHRLRGAGSPETVSEQGRHLVPTDLC